MKTIKPVDALSEEADRDLLELADISTDKQIEDIKKGKLKKKNESNNKKSNQFA